MRAKGGLLEESRHELVAFDIVDVLLFEGALTAAQSHAQGNAREALIGRIVFRHGAGCHARSAAVGSSTVNRRPSTDTTVCLPQRFACSARRSRGYNATDIDHIHLTSNFAFYILFAQINYIFIMQNQIFYFN